MPMNRLVLATGEEQPEPDAEADHVAFSTQLVHQLPSASPPLAGTAAAYRQCVVLRRSRPLRPRSQTTDLHRTAGGPGALVRAAVVEAARDGG